MCVTKKFTVNPHCFNSFIQDIFELEYHSCFARIVGIKLFTLLLRIFII